MKRHLIMCLATLALCGCDSPPPTSNNPSSSKTPEQELEASGIYQIRVRGCQYIAFVKGGTGVALIHAEDCDNPIHKH